MNGNRAAIRYAKALLQEAGNDAGAVYADMETVKDTLSASKELRSVLKSPVITTEDKKAALLAIFSEQGDKVKSLIQVLSNNQRTDILGNIAESYLQLYNEAQGVQIAKVTTAIPISAALEKEVLQKVEELTGSKQVTLENEVDESIIGGFILRIGDSQYNASIANQLGNLKREFSKSL